MQPPAPAGRQAATPLAPLVDTIESATALDAVAKPIAKFVRNTVPPGTVKDALSGTWLGHAVHPTLTDVVIGCFVSATVLDLLGGDRDGRAQRRLIGTGLAAAAPTALTGVTDYSDSEIGSAAVRRAGIVHAFSNSGALVLYSGSLVARGRGAGRGGVALSLGGAAMLVVSCYLGGHITLARGTGVNQTAFDPGPDDWVAAADAARLQDGRPTRVVLGETPVLVLRDGDRILAIHDRCSHRGCSLAEMGEIEGDRVVCGCHHSIFNLSDGSIERGPATEPQPAFQARVRDGTIELRRIEAGRDVTASG
jgi:nitrite reductase/ring-hydroxylating ferredoxin subunit/uncharacterized membrane protein